MPKIVLQGFCHKAGTFTDRETGECIDYDNVVLEVTSDTPLQSQGVHEQGGCHINEIKIKTSLMQSIFVPAFNNINSLANWVGKEIACTYVPQGNRNVIAEVKLVQK